MKNIINYIKNNKKNFILLFTSFLLFLIISLLMITENINYLDTLIHSYILEIRNDKLTSILSLITKLADASFLLAISTILIIFMKNKKISLYMLLNLIIAFFTNEIFKSIFTRSRPVGINLIEEIGYSYPSGHSMVALSFYGFITYILYKNIKKKQNKIILIIFSSILIVSIGFSRIYLGVHYLSDVVAGFLLATIYLTMFIKIIKLERK